MERDAYERLGGEIRKRRSERGWTLEFLSDQLRRQGLKSGHSVQHLSEVERGRGIPSAGLIRALEHVLQANNELLNLLRDAKVPSGELTSADDIKVTAHLFYPAAVDCALRLVEDVNFENSYVSASGVHNCNQGRVAIYEFPFRVVVVHERHTVVVSSLTDLSMWRSEQIKRASTCVDNHLREELDWQGTVVDESPYCFSAFVVEHGPWTDKATRDNAVRILAIPSLLQRVALRNIDDALSLERQILLGGLEQSDLVSFNLESNLGWASWSAVALWEPSESTELERQLVPLEVQLQALWCYANSVSCGLSPASEEFGERFFRLCFRTFRRPHSTEHISSRLMREAIVKTSRLEEMISCALDALSSHNYKEDG